MQALVGPATWYVRPEDESDYNRAGASHVVTSGGLCVSRNVALDAAFKQGAACIELSDDLTRIERVFGIRGVNKTVTASFDWAVATMVAACDTVGAFLAGVAPTTNKLFYKEHSRLTFANFIVGDFIYVKPCALRFDEAMRLKEDYDYTLQHLNTYGRVARCNNVFAYFSHRKNAGGAVAYRTADLEQQTIAHLKGKWGHHIRDNPKRPNEVILKWT